MRRKLFIALGVTLALSAWSLLRWPKPDVVAVSNHTITTNQTSSVMAVNQTLNPLVPQHKQPLPAHWNAPEIGAATRNPFEVTQPIPTEEQKKEKKLAQAAIQPMVVPLLPPPPAPAPALTYRFVGRMLNPDGKRFVYIAQGDTILAVQVGTQLKEGYVVESISDAAIDLLYPPLQQHVSMPLPHSLIPGL